jgi:hypothetical protein
VGLEPTILSEGRFKLPLYADSSKRPYLVRVRRIELRLQAPKARVRP